MTQRILVINPNSSQRVTDAISAAVAALRLPGGPAVDCICLPDGPAGIETQDHVDHAGRLVARAVAQHEHAADAFVVACFSDPGLHAAREATAKPVMGIAESGLLTAMALGNHIGVISILAASLPRHWRYFRAMGIDGRVVADLPVGLGVAALSDETTTFARMREVGRALIEEHGADVLVMGCAGMARYRAPLEDALGRPVVDPSQAAVGMALTALRFNMRTSIARPEKPRVAVAGE
ncbi:MAG: aspartate/glutamate racemase family protein [Alphaproteobacteria bacterium]|nr:aspartate/glutamate racemase family protein [Alphaproteobacteria bacterium]